MGHAVDAPRFHHQYLPDRIDLEKKFPQTQPTSSTPWATPSTASP